MIQRFLGSLSSATAVFTLLGGMLLLPGLATAQPTSQPTGPRPSKPQTPPVRPLPTQTPPVRPLPTQTPPVRPLPTQTPPVRPETKASVPAPLPRPVVQNPPKQPQPTAVPSYAKPMQVAQVTDRYDMYFRHKKVGEFTRTEKRMNNGFVRVENQSRMNIRMLFTTVKASNHSDCLYDQTGQLLEFTITSKVRGKITTYTGKRDRRGLTITESQGKHKKQGFFPTDSFQGTSLDYRFPPAQPGITIRRQYLIIPRMQMVEQWLSYRETTPRKVFGQQQAVYEIIIRNQRGRGMVLVTQDGRMVASRMLGKLGVVEIRWNGTK